MTEEQTFKSSLPTAIDHVIERYKKLEKLSPNSEKMEMEIDGKTVKYNFELLDKSRIKDIHNLYKQYEDSTSLPKEFLYIPENSAKNDEVANVFDNPDAAYLGLVLETGELAAVTKVYRCEDEPFFVAPQNVIDSENKGFHGISGLLVNTNYQKKHLGKKLVNLALASLETRGTSGVYADCDFRNVASFKTLSRHMGWIGYSDGRKGAEGEKTIYLTFFKQYSYNSQADVRLDFADTYPNKKQNDPLEKVANKVENTLNQLGSATTHRVEYGGGYNEIHVLDQPVNTQGIKLDLGRWNPRENPLKLDLTNIDTFYQNNDNSGSGGAGIAVAKSDNSHSENVTLPTKIKVPTIKTNKTHTSTNEKSTGIVVQIPPRISSYEPKEVSIIDFPTAGGRPSVTGKRRTTYTYSPLNDNKRKQRQKERFAATPAGRVLEQRKRTREKLLAAGKISPTDKLVFAGTRLTRIIEVAPKIASIAPLNKATKSGILRATGGRASGRFSPNRTASMISSRMVAGR